MTITIELPPDVAEGIARRAADAGQDAADYVRRLAALDVQGTPAIVDGGVGPQRGGRTPEERADAFVRRAYAHSAAAPPLSDKAVSRESFYADTGDD